MDADVLRAQRIRRARCSASVKASGRKRRRGSTSRTATATDGRRCLARSKNTSSTLLSISEGEWPETQKGLDQSYGNCHGWTQMSCALKAYVEHAAQHQ